MKVYLKILSYELQLSINEIIRPLQSQEQRSNLKSKNSTEVACHAKELIF